MPRSSAKQLYSNLNSNFYDTQLQSPNPLRRWFHHNRYRLIRSFVEANFLPESRILDIGAASCNWNSGKLPVWGLDFSQPLLEQGKLSGRLKGYNIGDLCGVKFPENSFDILVAAEVLEHLSDVDSLVKEAYRILADGGVFIISVPDESAFSLWKPLFALQVFLHGHLLRDPYYRSGCGHLQHFSLESISKILSDQGFSLDLRFGVYGLENFLLARKKGRFLPDKISYDDLTIIIPVLNEAREISRLLDELIRLYPGARIIVSDDGSSDGSQEIVNRMQKQCNRIYLAERGSNRIKGLTASVLDGIAMTKTAYFIVMDGDGQHDPRYVEDVYRRLKLGEEICVAARVVAANRDSGRRLFSWIGSFMARAALYFKLKNIPDDPLSGFFGARSEFWRQAVRGKPDHFKLSGYKVLFDFLKHYAPESAGANIYYLFNLRQGGSSKINFKVYRQFIKSIFF